MMKKQTIILISVLISLSLPLFASAVVTAPSQGGTGTSTVPMAGQLLIGTTGNVYKPNSLTAGTNITISTSSGAVVISTVSSPTFDNVSTNYLTVNTSIIGGNINLGNNNLLDANLVKANYFWATSTSQSSTFAGGFVSQASSTVVGYITATGGFNGNASSSNDLICTDCINATEIEDIYFLTVGDIVTGSSTFTGTLDVIATTTSGMLNVGSGKLYMNGNGKIGISTSTPRYTLDVWGDLAVGTTTSPIFYADVGKTGNAPQIIIGADISVGSIQVASSSGAITLVDMSVDGGASAGTEESYSFQIDSNQILSIYSESDGVGGIQNKRVGINTTTTPRYMLDVRGRASFGTTTNDSIPLLFVSSFTTNVQIATTTGTATFNVNSKTGTSTTANVSDASGFGGANVLQAPNGKCYSQTCNGIDASGCGWATTTCPK